MDGPLPEFDHDTSLWTSVKDYAVTLGRWGWTVIVCGILGEVLTVVLFFVALAHAPVPEGAGAWIWLAISLIVAALVAIPFFSFHQQRLEHLARLKSLTSRHAQGEKTWQDKLDEVELARSLQVKSLTGQLNELKDKHFALQAECVSLRDLHDFRNALSVELRGEFYPEGDTAQFRLAVTNGHPFRMVDDVCIRVLELECIDGSDKRPRLPITKPPLALTNSGRLPFTPHKFTCNVPAASTILFDFVVVHSGRRANHHLNYGECIRGQQIQFQPGEQWERAHDPAIGAGMYRVVVEVQGRDVNPLRRKYVFWGDKRGPRCVDSSDTAVQSAHPLSFALDEIETLPPKMHPHQLEALERVLRQPEYDKMMPTAVFWKLNDDPHYLGGLAGLNFVTAEKAKEIPETRRDRTIVVTDEYAAKFPHGIPGFPNVIFRSDFDIAWKAARD